MNKNKFIEDVYEIAFGDNAINKGYTEQEVLDKLKNLAIILWKKSLYKNAYMQ